MHGIIIIPKNVVVNLTFYVVRIVRGTCSKALRVVRPYVVRPNFASAQENDLPRTYSYHHVVPPVWCSDTLFIHSFIQLMSTSELMSKSSSAIHWFRKGLRLHDNPALCQACAQATTVYPVFILDPHFSNPEIVGVNRYSFLLQTLRDLDESLKNVGSRLYLFRGNPKNIFPILFDQWNINILTYEKDTEPYAITRDLNIQEIAKNQNVEVDVHSSHTLHDMDSYKPITGTNHKTTYAAFVSFFETLDIPDVPLESPSEVKYAFVCVCVSSFSVCYLIMNVIDLSHQELYFICLAILVDLSCCSS